jgi:PAS domain S-box-containing protein
MADRDTGAHEELDRIRQALTAKEQLFETYERRAQAQARRLEQVIEDSERTKRHLAAQYVTALALAESASFAEAVQRILGAICMALDCEHGFFWRVDRDAQLLRCVETWHSPGAEYAQFDKTARTFTFSRGIGLPGRIWATREPAWISDVTQDANAPRALAASVGVHGAFGFPIVSGNDVQGVLEFFSAAPRQPDDALLKVLTGIGSQIGQVAERRETEEALRQSEERTRLILDAALDAVVTMSEQGMITGWNAMAERTFGWAAAQVIGRRMSDTIIPAQYREQHERGLRHFLATGEGPVLNKRIEITALHRDGHEFPVELAITPVRLTGSWIFSAFVRNIAERKRTEAMMREAKEAAEAMSRAKSQFLANVSHEIRTPMNGILGLTELTLDSELTADQRDNLEMVKLSGDSLMVVINDILDFSKIETGTFELDNVEFSVRGRLHETVGMFAVGAARKGLQLVCDVESQVPPTVAGDPARLRQIILNLLGNAIKFTERGQVVLHVEKESQEDQRITLHFSVRDTGIGVPLDKQHLIFEAFVQADGSHARKYGGTGLGLSISSRLVEMMGGRIWVESEFGHGSAFHFTASFGVASAPAANEEPRRT